MEARDAAQRKVLWLVLLVNAAMFLVEIGAGIVGQSTGLIADSLDMLADALIYAISLYAVGRSLSHKLRAASLSGMLQVLLGLGALADVLRRLVLGSEPHGELMIVISLLALAANTLCLTLIARHRDGGAHMRASWIFTKVDVIANLGVIISGGLVVLLGSRLPDLLIGFSIVFLVLRGGINILRDARQEWRMERDKITSGGLAP